MMQEQIVELLWQRDEQALRLLEQHYGAYCRSLAARVLDSSEDVEECFNDTLLRLWQSIPPQRPQNLALFSARIMRNLAFDRFRRNRAQKRGGGELPLLLDELAESIPDGRSRLEADNAALRSSLERFLRSLPERSRCIFIFRYWANKSIGQLAAEYRCSESSIKTLLFRCRRKLKQQLESEYEKGDL